MADGFLHVMVHNARGLPAADFRLLQRPTSDPYCVLLLNGEERCTRTISETLEPIWDDSCSFVLGVVSPVARVIRRLRNRGRPAAVEEPPVLEVAVWDEDQWSSDDFLGSASLAITRVLEAPGQWFHEQLQLRNRGVGNACQGGDQGRPAGTLLLSLYFEPAVFLSSYMLRIFAVVNLSVAGALLLIAAACRWQRAPSLELATAGLKEPGVGVVVVLASLCCFVSAAIHFVLAHLPGGLDSVKLLEEHVASMGRAGALGDKGQDELGLVFAKVHPASLTTYELNLKFRFDWHLPVCVLSWLLLASALALVLLALLLQCEEADFRLPHLEAGELLDLMAGLLILVGATFIVRINHEKRRIRSIDSSAGLGTLQSANVLRRLRSLPPQAAGAAPSQQVTQTASSSSVAKRQQRKPQPRLSRLGATAEAATATATAAGVLGNAPGPRAAKVAAAASAGSLTEGVAAFIRRPVRTSAQIAASALAMVSVWLDPGDIENEGSATLSRSLLQT
eukprot:TRINITY_DN25382_c0_g1_i1.p1 TRINITY_DN25382_c0_g1~~TRINITY_DN25382_c0_g1_i1.p1  ORF type:complete len:507 (-),score=106.72 TRINITY_DN25382_c0_g1_i1:111-1631(-)